MSNQQNTPTPRLDQAIKAAHAAIDDIKLAALTDFEIALAEAEVAVGEQAAAALKTPKGSTLRTMAIEATKAVKAVKAKPAEEKDPEELAAETAELQALANAVKSKTEAPASAPTPTPTPAPDQPNTDAAWRQRVDARLDGHDHRFEQTERNLTALNGAVGIMKDNQGTWVPTADGQFARNAAVQEHLGYGRSDDGTVSFADRAASVADDFSLWVVLVCLAIGAFLGWLLGHVFLFFRWGLFGPVGGIFLGALVGAVVSLWLAKKDN